VTVPRMDSNIELAMGSSRASALGRQWLKWKVWYCLEPPPYRRASTHRAELYSRIRFVQRVPGGALLGAGAERAALAELFET
ncbi:MAG TPA: hypothetical protein VGI35_05750, partial [Steroidobacteraceae bacterium]